MSPTDHEVQADLDLRELGRRLREVREYLGLSQQYVTAATGIPRSAISEIERGNRKVDSLELRRLARVYQCPVSRFLGDPDPVETGHVLERAFDELTAEDQEEMLRFAQFLSFRARRD